MSDRECAGFDKETAIRVCRFEGGHWPKGVRKLNAALKSVGSVTPREFYTPQPTDAMVGFAPIVPNVLAGIPNSMLAIEELPAVAPVVKVGINVGRSHSVDESTVYNRAAAVLSLLDLLASQGYQTELWAVWRNTAHGDRMAVDVLVKDATADWDITTAAFAFGCPAMQRRLMWACAERGGEEGAAVTNSGYGNGRRETGDDFDMYFPYLSDDLSPARAITQATDVAKKSNIEIDFSGWE
jgi:hypothetical protein